MKYEINVYDKKGKVVKTAEAQSADLTFGAIRKIMELLNIESVGSTTQLLATVYGAWDELVKVLSQCFPDMERDDWENVKMKELMPVVIGIIKHSFAEILTIPKDPKN